MKIFGTVTVVMTVVIIALVYVFHGMKAFSSCPPHDSKGFAKPPHDQFCSLQEALKSHSSIDDYRILHRSLETIGDWWNLCDNLEVDEGTMNTLYNSHGQPEVKKRQCLKAYVDSGEASWEEVVIAVARSPFKNKVLAKSIAKRHLHDPNLNLIIDMLEECSTYL